MTQSVPHVQPLGPLSRASRGSFDIPAAWHRERRHVCYKSLSVVAAILQINRCFGSETVVKKNTVSREIGHGRRQLVHEREKEDIYGVTIRTPIVFTVAMTRGRAAQGDSTVRSGSYLEDMFTTA